MNRITSRLFQNKFFGQRFKYLAQYYSTTNEKTNDAKSNFENESLSELLETSSLHNMESAFNTIKSLVVKKAKEGLTYEEFSKNMAYKSLYEQIISGIPNENIEKIVFMLNCLLYIGAPSNSEFVISLRDYLFEKTSSDQTIVDDLLHIFNVISKNPDLDTDGKILSTLATTIEEKYSDIKSANCICLAYANKQRFSESFMKKFDEHVSDLCIRFTFKELLVILEHFAVHKQRSLNILNTISNEMINKIEEPPTKVLLNTLSFMSQLSYINSNFLNLSLNKLSLVFSDASPNMYKSMLIVLYRNRINHPNIFESLSLWIRISPQVSVHTLNSFLAVLAHANYIPENFDVMLQPFIENFNAIETVEEKLDFVWYLTILNKASDEVKQNVLTDDVVDLCARSKYHKILNINASIDPKYKLKEKSIEKIMINVDSYIPSQHIKNCMQVLKLFVPQAYIKFNVLNSNGFIVNAEIIADEEGNFLNIDEYPNNGQNVLPEKFKRLAIMFYSYKDYTLLNGKLLGKHLLHEKFLVNNGYHVVPVTNLNFKESNYKNINIIKNAINSCFLSDVKNVTI